MAMRIQIPELEKYEYVWHPPVNSYLAVHGMRDIAMIIRHMLQDTRPKFLSAHARGNILWVLWRVPRGTFRTVYTTKNRSKTCVRYGPSGIDFIRPAGSITYIEILPAAPRQYEHYHFQRMNVGRKASPGGTINYTQRLRIVTGRRHTPTHLEPVMKYQIPADANAALLWNGTWYTLTTDFYLIDGNI